MKTDLQDTQSFSFSMAQNDSHVAQKSENQIQCITCNAATDDASWYCATYIICWQWHGHGQWH